MITADTCVKEISEYLKFDLIDEDLYEMVTDKKNALEDEIRREFAERGKDLDNILNYITEVHEEEVPDEVEVDSVSEANVAEVVETTENYIR